MTLTERVADGIARVRERIENAASGAGRRASDVQLVGVTKGHSIEHVEAALDAGLQDIGENYVQELVSKREELKRDDARWHYIGHLQRNKARQIVPFVSLIHGVDSERLAKEIDKQGRKHNRIIPILLQVNTSGESSKFGCLPGGAEVLAERVRDLEFVELRGLMTMAALDRDPDAARPMFRLLRETRDLIQKKTNLSLPDLSMGMSHDFEVAVEEGATIVRIGSEIFGPRDYGP